MACTSLTFPKGRFYRNIRAIRSMPLTPPHTSSQSNRAPSARHRTCRCMNAGATLVLVKADPLSAVQEHFLNKISVEGSNKLFIISNAGHKGHKVEAGGKLTRDFYRERDDTVVCKRP